MSNEVHAHTLGADQPHDLFNPIQQRLRGVIEQQVRLIKEQHKPGLVGITNLRQLLKQLGQQPQKDTGIAERALPIQALGMQDIDHALTVLVDLEKVIQRDGRLAKQRLPALLFQTQQRALDSADAGR